MIKKTVLILTALLAATAGAEQQIDSQLQNSAENVAPAFHNEVKERALPALNYVNQPPMVPHSVKNYQVTKNTNQCLNCHSVEASRVTGATRISPTHFMDREGNFVGGTASPRRYFCLQCHVSQSDVDPIVPNEFKPMKGYGE
ncbi:nitrate reductase cytochrome c-type subunit [Caviibacterium pharyngocola]|uniref:Periplasmic nitrate reductase, electron transfer subunit n=1 Tax=Caviibacterium pharyngocola TaxID=28159 RepID=A0A2M8RXF3_9PAST|nr:nitrate reductase cytochrome c-type subunit [Caviibacterium pharyngocola]PJG83573.1 diacylglycerol kinase [Caviibacterium pharyngocola]